MDIGIGAGFLTGLAILVWGAVVGVGLLAFSEMIKILLDIAGTVKNNEDALKGYGALRLVKVVYKIMAFIVFGLSIIGFMGAIMAGACAEKMIGDETDDRVKALEELRQNLLKGTEPPSGLPPIKPPSP